MTLTLYISLLSAFLCKFISISNCTKKDKVRRKTIYGQQRIQNKQTGEIAE